MDSQSISMTEGPMLGNVIHFAIPIILSNLLQITFNAADSAVVGQFAGRTAVAAVGAANPLINLMINLFIGLATGTLIAVSYSLGERNYRDARLHTHNSIATAIVCGIVIAVLSITFARPLLSMMQTPPDVLNEAVTYFSIYFAGAPLYLLYNYGAAILRANGDTRRPFLFLAIGGIANVVLNLIFVIGFHMTVDGVAIATDISNGIASFLVLRTLIKEDGPCRLTLRDVRIYPRHLAEILKYGLPAGIQNCMFSISNVLIQSSVNSFGSAATAGKAAALQLCGYNDSVNAGISETALTFVSHNYAAKKYDRCKKVSRLIVLLVSCTSVAIGVSIYLMRNPLLSIFIPGDTEAIKVGSIFLFYLAAHNITGANTNVLTSCIRGINKPVFPMVTTIFFVCVVRVIWIYTVFRLPAFHSIESISFTYPLTWVLACIALGTYLIIHIRKLNKPITLA